ncbi:unnamed protein product [Mortierella alpina]
MRTTTSGRAFAKGIFDLFSTLVVSLPIENHKILFKNYPNSFTAEEAIANLGGLQFIQSNRDTDPKDPTRIITHVTTTQFSLSRDMARNLCQTFMDARLFESASDPNKREFQSKGVYQVTPKGAHILAKFVHRNTLPVDETRHITANATANLVHLERADDEDAIILTQKHVEMIFKRFAGPEPNLSRGAGPGDSPLNSSSGGRDRMQSVPDLCNGIEVKDQQHNYDMYKHTFYGKSAVEWLLDYTSVISKEEAICICQEMVTAGYIEQVGEENRGGPSLFRTGNSSLYHLTESGRALAGWQSLDSSGSSINNDWMDERSTLGSKSERSNPEAKLLSAQFKLTSSSLQRLPISTAREKRISLDESSMTTSQYNEDTGRGSIRRLSQILNDPAFQITLEAGAMSSYAPSSSGRESVGASAGGTGLSPPLSSSQPMASNTTRLNIILSNSTLRDLFKSFLKQNICEENLSFYLEVLDYRSRFNTLINSMRAYSQSVSGQEQASNNLSHPPSLRELEKQICTQAFSIFETYLVLGAPREVNLPHQMRLDITGYMQAVVRNMEMLDKPASVPSSPLSASADTNEDDRMSSNKELIHIALFDSIHEHIFRLMSTDSVPKFTKTDKYREVMMNRVKQSSGSAPNGSAESSPTASGGTPPSSVGNNGSAGGVEDGMSRTSMSGASRNEEKTRVRRSYSFSERKRVQSSQPANAEARHSMAMSGSGSMVGSGSRVPAANLSTIARTRTVTGNTTAMPKRQSVAVSSVSPAIVANTQSLPTVRSRAVAGIVQVVEEEAQEEAGPQSTTGNEMKMPRQPPATLLDIYAQQQQLRQYSNQRAQLTPAQIQSLYMGRSARGPAAESSVGANGTESTMQRPSGKASVSDQVTVLFESTSFSIQDTSADTADASGGCEEASAPRSGPVEQMSFAEMVSSLPPPTTV